MSNTQIVLRIFSFIIIAVGLYYGGYGGLIEPNLPGHSYGTENKIQLALGLSVIFLGLIGLVLSQVADIVLKQK